MATYRYNPVLLVLIAIGLAAALVVNWQRHGVEQANSRVEMVMDYEDIVELAQTEGVPLDTLMRQFKEAGVTTLAVYETTLEKLAKSGRLTVLSGAQLADAERAGYAVDPALGVSNISTQNLYVIGDGPVFEETWSDLIRRLGPERVILKDTTPRRKVLEVLANPEKVMKWNLGLPTHELKAASGYGFNVIARPTNYTKVRPEDVEAVFARLQGIPNVTGIMFVGEEVLGYPDLLPLTAQRMKEQGLTLAMIEHPLQLGFVRQEGLLPLATLVNYQAARVYVIPKDEQPKLKVAEAVHRWVVTDQERNIRINLLRKYDKAEPGQTVVETNLAYVAAVKQGLAAKGFTLGPAGTFAPYFPAAWLLALVVTGATAAGVLYLTLVYPFAPRWQYLLVALIAAVLTAPLLKGGGTLTRQAAALASAILMPVLAMTWQLDRWRRRPPTRHASLGRILGDGVASLTLTVLLALTGGLYVGALLGDVRFLLEMEIYRGVKLTFVAPLVLITVVYLTRYDLFGGSEVRGIRDLWRQVALLLNCPVKIKTLLAFAVAAVVLWVFVGRSGHTAGVPVPAIEIKLRTFLEQVMYARPREKEFLIGHPAFFLAVMALYHNWPRVLHYVLVVAATIAQGSLVETFAHLRTPVFMSLVRGLDGLAVGMVFGVLAVTGIYLLRCLSCALARGPVAK